MIYCTIDLRRTKDDSGSGEERRREKREKHRRGKIYSKSLDLVSNQTLRRFKSFDFDPPARHLRLSSLCEKENLIVTVAIDVLKDSIRSPLFLPHTIASMSDDTCRVAEQFSSI